MSSFTSKTISTPHLERNVPTENMYCAVILQSKKKLVLPSGWVQNKYSSNPTRIFFSKNESDQPNFESESYYFLRDFPACYHGYFLKEYGKQ